MSSSFAFINNLKRRYDDIRENVTSVSFPIGRYAISRGTLLFPQPVTEKEAVQAVEEHLSKPLTSGYLGGLLDLEDLPQGNMRGEAIRGDCLGSTRILSAVVYDWADKGQHLALSCEDHWQV